MTSIEIDISINMDFPVITIIDSASEVPTDFNTAFDELTSSDFGVGIFGNHNYNGINKLFLSFGKVAEENNNDITLVISTPSHLLNINGGWDGERLGPLYASIPVGDTVKLQYSRQTNPYVSHFFVTIER